MRTILQTGLLVLLCAGPLFAQNAGDVIKRTQQEYERAKDFSIEFVHLTKWSLTSMTDSLAGTMLIQGDKYRFESGSQTIVTDGTTVWSYSSVTNQLIIEPYDKDSDEFLPREMMFRFPKNYNATLQPPALYEGRQCQVLLLVPKKDNTLTKNLRVWVDTTDWLMRKFEFLNVDDNLETYRLINIRRDTGLSPALFKYDAPPAGAEVLDMRQ